MKVYFAFISNAYVPQNKLEKSLLMFLHSQNRKVIYAANIEKYKKTLLAGIDLVNTENTRCIPKEINFWQPNKDIYVHGLRVAEFTLLEGEL